jgi:division protein CdvB (Snf7/Vps24/ESCRT-III family)
LSNKFSDKWKQKGHRRFTPNIRRLSKPSQGLKKRLNLAIRRLELQIQGLNNALERFSKRDKSIFKRIVKSHSARDTLRANVLASELAELRKTEKTLMQTKLALESISLRLETISELGEVITVLAPATNVIKNVQSGITNLFPEANRELENIGTLPTEIASSTSQTTGMPINVEAANQEAKKILKEAESAAEQRIRHKLPETATETSVKEKAELSAQ